jgi:Tfp pilus assembly protein PilV
VPLMAVYYDLVLASLVLPEMNSFFLRNKKCKTRGGFSLVEATLSLGLLSFGFLTLAALLAVGLNTARSAHTSRDSTQIAQSLIEEAKQGTLPMGTTYLDFQGNPANQTGAAYSAQSTFSSISGNTAVTRLTLRITPVGAPDRARTYAVVIPTP